MPALLEFSIIPLDQEKTISRFVARVCDLIRDSGLPCRFGPMSCCIEGEWGELMGLATRCFEALAVDSRHLHVDMRVLWRAEQAGRLERTPGN